jgi:hypothetical protein
MILGTDGTSVVTQKLLHTIWGLESIEFGIYYPDK